MQASESDGRGWQSRMRRKKLSSFLASCLCLAPQHRQHTASPLPLPRIQQTYISLRPVAMADVPACLWSLPRMPFARGNDLPTPHQPRTQASCFCCLPLTPTHTTPTNTLHTHTATIRNDRATSAGANGPGGHAGPGKTGGGGWLSHLSLAPHFYNP